MRKAPTFAALLTSVLLAGCARDGVPGRAGATTTSAALPQDASPPAPSALPPNLDEPRLTALSALPASLADVAPGRPADGEHPAGTVYVATVLGDGNGGRGKATLFEWDIASARLLNPQGRLLYRESDEQDFGKSTEVRIATTRDTLFVAVTLEREVSPLAPFLVLGRAPLVRDHGNPFQDRAGFPAARDVSLESDGRWLVVGYERLGSRSIAPELPRTGIALCDAMTMKRVAVIPFAQSHEPGVRYDNLEILNGRLFAAEPMGAKVRVVELAMPSLRVLHGVDVDAPGSSSVAQLTSARGHLFALRNGALIELTPELDVVGKRAIHASEVAPGPGGELLTPLGLDEPGGRGDYVPNLSTTASCTPTWAGAFPLLACSVDPTGVEIARLAPPAR